MDVTKAIHIARMTDIGLLRERNEDAVASDLSTGQVVVADGMGGYRGGSIASEIAILVIISEVAELMQRYQTLKQPPPLSAMLRQAVAKANNTILNAAEESTGYEGMGTTFVSGIFSDNKLTVGHMGDSRLYRLRSGILDQLTEDHSLLQEQINAGLMTEEQAKKSNEKHLVTRALGTDADFELEINEYEVSVNDVYLFCSDGLTDCVEDEEICEILLNMQGEVDSTASSLIALANKRGGTDNISVVLAFVAEPFAVKRNWVQKVLG